jgi:hypothetical protein
MKLRTLLVAALLVAAWTGTAGAATSNPNDPAYYETGTSVCYKAESTTAHGTVQGGTVVLNPHQAGWYGTGWVLLVVKGGDDRNIYEHPTAGVPYSTPTNGGGQVPDVSHWIVCKGTVETTTTTPPETTTTTVPETTTTVPETTTTVPETTTSTVPDPCDLATTDHECGPQPDQTPPPVEEPPATPLADTERIERLPRTGVPTGLLVASALGMLGLGKALVTAERRRS